MKLSGDLSLLRRGLASAGALSHRLVGAIALLASILLSWLLLALFPGGGLDPVASWRAVSDRPDIFGLLIAGIVVITWAIWSLAFGLVMRGIALNLAGRPASLGELHAFTRRQWASLFFLPPASIAAAGVLVGFAWVLVLSVLIPWVGWVLLLVLSPVIVLLGRGAIRIVLTWLIAGHVGGAGVAVEGSSLYPAISRYRAWLRKSPAQVVVSRLVAMVIVFARSTVSIAITGGAAVLLWLLLGAVAPEARAGVETTLRQGFGTVDRATDIAAGAAGVFLVLLISWLGSAPLVLLHGARVALYLGHRLEFDGVPVDAPDPERIREKTIEELGVELVERIRDRAGKGED